MSPRGFGLSVAAFGGLLGAAGLAFALGPRQAPAALKPRRTVALSAPAAVRTTPASSVTSVASRFELLGPIQIENQTTRETRELKLYDAHGQVDENTARELDELLCDARDPKHHETTRIDRRTLQLLFKVAYHFGGAAVEVVSAYRRPGRHGEGPHGTGSAIDFRLRGVGARELASFLRQIPRTGVGIYTHPKTQYVHLDNREHSFHWIDASPPRRHWRERSIGTRDLARVDQSYTPNVDLPDPR